MIEEEYLSVFERDEKSNNVRSSSLDGRNNRDLALLPPVLTTTTGNVTVKAEESHHIQ